MLRKFNKKRVLLVGLASLIVAAAAFAYWSASGGGTGSAGTATGTTAITVSGTSVSGLYPGATATGLSGTFNNTNSGSVHVNTITTSAIAQTDISAPNADVAHPCAPSDFTLVAPGTNGGSGYDVPAGTGGTWSGGSIRLENTGSNQDGCKGATVTIHYSAS